MANKTFKIIFSDKNKSEVVIDYTLHETLLAVKWFSKIKHLHNIDVDCVESGSEEDISDLKLIYKEFCEFADLPKISFEKIDQETCNILHKIYEENHDRLARRPNSAILYKLHHAIHKAEKYNTGITKFRLKVGWGIKEGPLTQKMNCQPYYENNIIKNNLYLPWSELGKTPYIYWRNREPNDRERFNQLCKPHITFRANFFVAVEDIKKPWTFPNQFNQFFNQFKSQWLEKYGLDDWTEKHQWCAPLLAHTDAKINLRSMQFKKIEI